MAAPTRQLFCLHDRVPAFALHHRHDGLLEVGTNDGVVFPMTHFQALLNVRWALAQRSVIEDLSLAVLTTGVALSLLLLETLVHPQSAAMRFVCINLQVQRFMAHGQLAGDLLWPPLQPKENTGLLFHQGRKRVGVAARFGAFAVKLTSLFVFVTSTPGIATQLTTDPRLVSSKQSGNLHDVVLGFHKAVHLISLVDSSSKRNFDLQVQKP